MSIADEIRKLDELRRAGSLTDDEFSQAKATLLRTPSEVASLGLSDQVADHLAAVSCQNELAQVDREWEIEREQYLVFDRFGRALVPQVGGSRMFDFASRGSFGMGLAATIFGVGWTTAAIVFTHDAPFAPIRYVLPGFGVLFTFFGLTSALRFSSMVKSLGHEYERKARRYQVAFEEYQGRRQAALARQQSSAGTPIPPPNTVPVIGSAWLES